VAAAGIAFLDLQPCQKHRPGRVFGHDLQAFTKRALSIRDAAALEEQCHLRLPAA
jgi:hypothetical protein